MEASKFFEEFRKSNRRNWNAPWVSKLTSFEECSAKCRKKISSENVNDFIPNSSKNALVLQKFLVAVGIKTGPSPYEWTPSSAINHYSKEIT